jgi:mannose-6-phosphate isomerase-like protein (cupin superfamily)
MAAATALTILTAGAAGSSKSRRPASGFVVNVEEEAKDNTDYRRVLFTVPHLQLVLMTLKPGEEIGEEVHPRGDQYIRIESGKGEARISGLTTSLTAGSAVLIPAGAPHNIKNTGEEPLKLYTLYGPPEHKDGTVQATKADSAKSREHFDGKTTQ